MKIYAVADIHGKSDRMAWIENVVDQHQIDLLVIAGDISGRFSIVKINEFLNKIKVKSVLVPGNADSGTFVKSLDVLTSISNLHLSHITVDGFQFYGAGGAVPIPFFAKIQWKEREILSKLESQLNSESILVTHTPPRGAGDKVLGKFSAGSNGLADLIQKTQPRLNICGHIHECDGVDYLGKTCVVNCSMGGNGKGALLDITKGEENVKVELLAS